MASGRGAKVKNGVMKRSHVGPRLIRLGGIATAIAAIAPPAAVSLLAVGDEHPSTTAVALLFVLGVVASTSFGGQRAGLGAAILSFLSLNFFFTPPLHTFTVSSPTELIALIAFLAVSLGVGAFLSASIRDRVRAERRELELRLMNRLMTALLSGERVPTVLARFSDDINEMLGSARCAISTSFGEEMNLGGGTPTQGRAFQIQLKAKDRVVGKMSVWPTRGSTLTGHERQVIETFGKQLALALEGVRLSEDVRRSELKSEAHRVKASLFSGITHDVKTPLAAITAAVTSLLEGRGFSLEQSREHLEMIKDEAQRLHRLVNNMLDLGRLQAGVHLPVKEMAAVDEVLESVVARMRPMFGGRDVSVRVADELPETPMDVVQIDRVLTNLIENALKFSPPPTPVSVSAVGDLKNVRITVADSGPGVAKQDEKAIFEPFQKGSHDYSGAGLGLAISRAIVVAHGGSIWASRPPQGGAAFTFELPRTPADAREVSSDRSSGSRR